MSGDAVNLQTYVLQRRPEVGQRIREIRTGKDWTQERDRIHFV